MRTLSRLGMIAAGCVLGLGGLAAADDKELKVGDPAPTFTAKDDQGKDWKSAEHVGKKVVVVYFYPADFTGGCTKQACAYRDDMDKLTAKGVEVVGVSGDSAATHDRFKKDHKLNYSLLADEDGSVAKKFGVPTKPGGRKLKGKDANNQSIDIDHSGVFTQRWTFVIGKDGKVLYKNSKVDAGNDSKAILDVVNKQS
jgi:peroxiredoxin Q/BCP